MCTVCGCGEGETRIEGQEHSHDHEHGHHRAQDPAHQHHHHDGHALESLEPEKDSVLFIENVGNLVCPAAFDLGEVREEVSLALVDEVMELRRSFEWRGLGLVPYSALRIKREFARFDAERRFELPATAVSDVRGCECPRILRGVKRPTDRKLFGTVCTPENPIGSCMVSSEGACAAYWSYGRSRQQEPQEELVA